MRITEHFDSSELAQPARHGFERVEYPQRWVDDGTAELLCTELEAIRAGCGGKPMAILSGYRSPAYNEKIGGKPASQHMSGRAADIVVAGMSADDVYAVIEALLDSGEIAIGGLGQYDDFCHVDVRESPDGHVARWDDRHGGRLAAQT